jgi:hypothetical protein
MLRLTFEVKLNKHGKIVGLSRQCNIPATAPCRELKCKFQKWCDSVERRIIAPEKEKEQVMVKPAKEDLQSLWNRLGLIATVVSRFGAITKRRLQETIYLLSRLNKIHGGYNFEFQYYIPFSHTLDGDLIMLEHWKVITIDQHAILQLSSVKAGETRKIMRIVAKAKDFIKHNSHVIDNALQKYLQCSDTEFDLIALAVFILDSEKNINTKKLIDLMTFYRSEVDVETVKRIVDILETTGIIGGVEIENVLASDPVVERKTGYWKKQLNEMSDGRYMVEVYWFEYLHETGSDDFYVAWFDTEEEATSVYERLTSMEKVKKLLPKSPYGFSQVDPDWPIQVY